MSTLSCNYKETVPQGRQPQQFQIKEKMCLYWRQFISRMIWTQFYSITYQQGQHLSPIYINYLLCFFDYAATYVSSPHHAQFYHRTSTCTKTNVRLFVFCISCFYFSCFKKMDKAVKEGIKEAIRKRYKELGSIT